MTLASQLREVVNALSELLAQHVRLARAELADDARFVGVRVGLIAALAPLILVGYGFLCVGLALGLRHVMPVEWAFVLVGVLNLGGGLLGIWGAAKELSGRKVMNESLTALERSTALVQRKSVEVPRG
jgi:hypothetical protein